MFDPRPIPDDFKTFIDKTPFEKCNICEVSLLNEDVIYGICKYYSGKEVIFECAICAECSQNERGRISKESAKKMEEIMRSIDLSQILNNSEEDGLTRCSFCSAPKSESKNYSLFAYCEGRHMLMSSAPLMVCEKCNTGFQDQLSDQTRRGMEKFISDNFDCCPSFDELWDSKPTILV